MAWRSWWSQRFNWTQKNLSNRSCETVEVDNFRHIYIYYIWNVSCFVWLNVFLMVRSICLDPRVFPLAALSHLQGWRRLNYLYHSFPNQVYLPKECWCSFPSQIMSIDVGLYWRLLFKSRHGWSAKMQKCETALRQKTHGWVRQRGHHDLSMPSFQQG